MLPRRRTNWWRLGWLLGFLMFGAWALSLGAVWIWSTRDQARPAAAIVVLGAAQYDGRPSPVFAARLDHAVELYHAGVAPWLIVTGGKQEGDRTTEAATARAYAERHGVPADRIIGEDQSRNTLASVRGVAAVMQERDLRSAVFVSDPTHMLRVLRMARDIGIDGHGSPTPSSPVQRDAGAWLDAMEHELGGLAVYFVTGESP
jgi:uncharacterized SAM-binding protein YcdF (DUF218 family)